MHASHIFWGCGFAHFLPPPGFAVECALLSVLLRWRGSPQSTLVECAQELVGRGDVLLVLPLQVVQADDLASLPTSKKILS